MESSGPTHCTKQNQIAWVAQGFRSPVMDVSRDGDSPIPLGPHFRVLPALWLKKKKKSFS